MENTLLKNISEYYCKTHKYKQNEDVFTALKNNSINISLAIAEYAHREQKQINGKKYIHHPLGCLNLYRDFIDIKENKSFSINKDLLSKNGIPFIGVQEVCILHDVLEDTIISINEIESVFAEFNLFKYFEDNVKQPLIYITHNKSEDYCKYMQTVLKNPISSMVKMMDLTNNMNLLRLNKLTEKEETRFLKYFECFKLIENTYHFIEKVNEYNFESATKI